MRTLGPALVVFDFDGTLLREQTICEVLARQLGQADRMREFEQLTDPGDITCAREEMIRWFSDIPRPELLTLCDNARLARGVYRGVRLLRERGIHVSIASLTWEFAVHHFARRWSIDHVLATGWDASGLISHVWPEDKARWMRELADSLGVPQGRVAAVGDSAGDQEMLEAADLPVFVGENLPVGSVQWSHLPGADIDHVARFVLERWRTR